MTHCPEGDHGDSKYNLESLFNRADAVPRERKTAETAFVGKDELSEVYPDILTGKAFIDHALTRTDASSNFGVMVFRIDRPEGKNDEIESHPNKGFRMDVAGAIDAICKETNGVWGRLDSGIFGSFFPEGSTDAGLELAQKIRERLEKRGNKTVSIGIASYPTISFSKAQIVDNACKALDHAAFFGADSTVAFDSISLNISGDKLYQNGDIDGAVREYTMALMLDPSNLNVRNSLGVCYGIQGSFEKAKNEFETAMQNDSSEVMPVYNTGIVNMLMGNKEEALQLFHEADSLDDDVFEVAFQIGRLYLEMENPEKGKKFLKRATLLRPESGIAFRYLGECFASMDMIDEAVSAYKNAIRSNPNDADSLSALGYLFEAQGENPEIAKTFCKQSVEISPENGLFRHRLGRLYLKADRLDDAMKEFKMASHFGHDSREYVEKIENMKD
ncbi:tetratricopeptide repeat protein [Thermodesulfobacteriota bacterium]